jgi:hypothetical protein
MMYIYVIEFGHFTKQLVNFYYYVTFSVMMYIYDIEFGHFKKQLANFYYYVIITLHFLL